MSITVLLLWNGICLILTVCFSVFSTLLIEPNLMGLDSSDTLHGLDNVGIHCGLDIVQAKANYYDHVPEVGLVRRVGTHVSFLAMP